MKILGSDFDGTLNHGGVNEDKLSAIEKWRKSGNKFGIVSGRGKGFREYLLKHFPKLEFDFFVSCNGGYIMTRDGTVLYEARFEDVSLLELLGDLFSWGCRFAHVDERRYVCVLNKQEDRPPLVDEIDTCLLENCEEIECFNQVSVELPSAKEAALVIEKIKNKYGKKLTPLQNGVCIDIVPVGVNKAQGMYRIMELYGCAHGDVITVGDNVNDIDMIREFRSYAMESGVPELKKLAFGVVSDVTELLEIENS